MEEMELMQIENKRLREIIGSWRRLAQEKSPRRPNIVRESYVKGIHYKAYALYDVPADLPIQEALKDIKNTFLHIVAPYQFNRLDYSPKDKAWLVEVVGAMYVEMHVETKNKGDGEDGN
jgi:hypothetical protein